MRQFVSELKTFLSKDSIITERDIILKYSEDKSTIFKSLPPLVIKPNSKEEIIKIVKLCNKYKIKITSWGAGTSVTGACLSFSENNIILSLEKMNKIIEIDVNNLIAVVEPAVITGELKREVEKYNLFYPPDPASYDSSTIGGNVATNAGGASTVKYGVTGDYVTGIEVVLGNGDVLQLGGKFIKNSSGYNLKDIFIGSEGTLGIITKIFLKLLPKPEEKISIYVTFDELYNLLDAINILFRSSILPCSIEYMDDIVLKYLNQKYNLPDKNARASVIIELDENREKMIKIYEIFEKLEGFINFYPLENPVKEREIWSARRSIGEVLRENCKYIGKADISVPRGNVKEVIYRIKKLCENFNVEVACFGHAGDGNIHVNFLFNKNVSKELIKKMYKIVKDFNGTPSGEHGIGVLKKEYLIEFFGKSQIEYMRNIKKIFDPNNILNPDKIFDL